MKERMDVYDIFECGGGFGGDVMTSRANTMCTGGTPVQCVTVKLKTQNSVESFLYFVSASNRPNRPV